MNFYHNAKPELFFVVFLSAFFCAPAGASVTHEDLHLSFAAVEEVPLCGTMHPVRIFIKNKSRTSYYVLKEMKFTGQLPDEALYLGLERGRLHHNKKSDTYSYTSAAAQLTGWPEFADVIIPPRSKFEKSFLFRAGADGRLVVKAIKISMKEAEQAIYMPAKAKSKNEGVEIYAQINPEKLRGMKKPFKAIFKSRQGFFSTGKKKFGSEENRSVKYKSLCKHYEFGPKAALELAGLKKHLWHRYYLKGGGWVVKSKNGTALVTRDKLSPMPELQPVVLDYLDTRSKPIFIFPKKSFAAVKSTGKKFTHPSLENPPEFTQVDSEQVPKILEIAEKKKFSLELKVFETRIKTRITAVTLKKTRTGAN